MLKVTVTKKGKSLESFLDAYKSITSYYNTIHIAADLARNEFIKASPNEDIANNWSYTITYEKNKINITFNNTAEIIESFHYKSDGSLDSAAHSGVNIAIIVDTGHATGDGRWIEGKHYLKEATDNACDAITSYLRKEMQDE